MTNWTTIVYGLLPHPHQPLVLAQSGSAEIDLPNLEHNDWVGPWNTYILQPMLKEKIGLPLNILRYIARHRDQESSRMYSIHLLEPQDEVLPSDASWQPLEVILEHTVMPAGLRDGLIQWQIERNSGFT